MQRLVSDADRRRSDRPRSNDLLDACLLAHVGKLLMSVGQQSGKTHVAPTNEAFHLFLLFLLVALASGSSNLRMVTQQQLTETPNRLQ